MLAIGQLLDGRYRVIQPLGAGGFGQTYLAQDTKIPNYPTCVVKHLKPATNNPQILETARRLFQTEGETLAILGNHPQIPRLLAYFEEDQEFYLVQEYIPGHTLDREIKPEERWSEERVVSLLQEVLPIIQFVHDRGVIHRDIKPSNLIRRANRPNLGLGESGTLVLIDFGAIKQIQTQLATNRAAVSVAIGTPGYMPIEQIKGQPRPSSDIYALGMVAIEALTGRSPQELWEDPHSGELVWQNLASVSPGLAGILSKMIRDRLPQRYQNASEVIYDLAKLQPSVSTSPVPPAVQRPATVPVVLPVPAKPSPPRHSPLVPLLIAGGVTGAVAAGLAFSPYLVPVFQSDRPSPTPSVVPSAISVATCTVRVSGLNVRDKPNGTSIATLNSGTPVALSGDKNGFWLKIVSPQTGWVRKQDTSGKVLVTCPEDVEVRPNPVPPTIRTSPRLRNTPTVRTSPRLRNTPTVRTSPRLRNTPTVRTSPRLRNTPTVRTSSTPSPTITPTNTPTPTPSPSSTATPIPLPEDTQTPIPIEVPTPEVPTDTQTAVPIEVPTPETSAIDGN